jgi:hypothetical protein
VECGLAAPFLVADLLHGRPRCERHMHNQVTGQAAGHDIALDIGHDTAGPHPERRVPAAHRHDRIFLALLSDTLGSDGEARMSETRLWEGDSGRSASIAAALAERQEPPADKAGLAFRDRLAPVAVRVNPASRAGEAGTA